MDYRDYSILGVTPTVVARPGSVGEVCEIVRSGSGKAFAPWGGGTRRHVGYAPERLDTVIVSAGLTGIVEYNPDDLTVTVRAGTPIADVAQTLSEAGQMLPIDVAAPNLQTVGGVIATRADSILRSASGSVRDALLGVDVVNGSGEFIRAGGRVVKNVSGYDLPKLYCGSLGTLGMIVEATFRTAPLPERRSLVLLPMAADRNTEDTLDALMSGRIQPAYVFLLNPEGARVVLEMPADEPDRQFIAIGLYGATEDVDWQIGQLPEDKIVLPDAIGLALHARIRDFSHHDTPMAAAFHIQSAQVGAFSRMVEWTARRSGFRAAVVTDAACGMMRATFSPMGDNSDWRVFYADLFDKATRCGGSFIVERVPPVLRELGIPIWSPVLPDARLMHAIKAKLDPGRVWNPGRFFDGI